MGVADKASGMFSSVGVFLDLRVCFTDRWTFGNGSRGAVGIFADVSVTCKSGSIDEFQPVRSAAPRLSPSHPVPYKRYTRHGMAYRGGPSVGPLKGTGIDMPLWRNLCAAASSTSTYVELSQLVALLVQSAL